MKTKMEGLVKQRKPVRISFTKTFNSLCEQLSEHEQNEEKIKFMIGKLERLSQEMSVLDERVLDVILQENEEGSLYEAEYTTIEEYKDKTAMARLKVEAYYSEKVAKSAYSENDVVSTCSSPTSRRNKLKLPKIELKKFGGDIKDWLSFWSQFKRIHDDKEIESEDKFQYLIQATIAGSRARDIVNSFPATKENYQKAIDSLHVRFGREELLIEFYVRELLGLVIQNVTGAKVKLDMAQLYDRLESHLRALESIGMTQDKYAAMLFPLVESCVPEEILRAWLRCPSSQPTRDALNGAPNTYSDKLQELLTFLRSEVEGEERISLAKAGFRVLEDQEKKVKTRQPQEQRIPTANNLFVGERNSKKRDDCIFCERQHESKECFQAQKMPLNKKREAIMMHKACFICLKVGHRSKDCKTSMRCVVCGKRHHVVMCGDLPINKEDFEVKQPKQKEEEENASALSNQCCSQEVLLQTLLVKLEANGKSRTVRALIDSGSQHSYILKSTVDGMGCVPVGSETIVQLLFGGAKSKREVHHCYKLTLASLKGNQSCNVQVLDQTNICGSIPRIKYGPILEDIRNKGMWLSDFREEQRDIELLIGADYAGLLFTGNKRQLEGGLSAMETLFGWVIMGRMPVHKVSVNYANVVTTLFLNSQSLPDLWSFEAIGIKDPCEVKTKEEIDAAVLDHFRETVNINSEGRYEVALPWLQDRNVLEENKEVAKNRLVRMTSKLKSEGKFSDNDEVFKTWVKDGVIEEVPKDDPGEHGHYLPHRGVFKSSSTTKVRPVFDASCKKNRSLSLNDCLAKGPNLLEVIPSVLMKFREKEIGIIADIRKAFLQVSVCKSDRDYLRFLWWTDGNVNKIKVFRHCRVVFGVNCSPFILTAVINNHLKNCPLELRPTAEILKRSFYVDNCVTSVHNEGELNDFISVASQLMSTARFELRGWEHTVIQQEEVVNEPLAVLGLSWDKKEDVLFCCVNGIKLPEGPITRRIILSVTQRVFDPIGFLCPATLLPKLLLQDSWKSKVSWDSEVSEDVKAKFLKWVQDLPAFSNVKIPRFVSLPGSYVKRSLHIFCDASQSSYAAVIYLRSEQESDNLTCVQLIQAKARVAPLKKTTIPRLELLACCIGARLAKSTRESLDLWDVPVYFWTDSTTALFWIKRGESWGTFVNNRVKEIRSISDTKDWHHVPGCFNPADLPSRGCSVYALLESKWWEGPDWLKRGQEDWPKSEYTPSTETIGQEKENLNVTCFVAKGQEETWYARYFSSYKRVLRLMAWILRFKNNIQAKPEKRQKGELSNKEIIVAEKLLVRIVQNETFRADQLTELKTLSVFADSENILRVKTKITSRKDTEDFRCPMILPSNHKVTRLLILEEHYRNAHAGTHILLSKLRERFWILRGRRTVRKVLSKCVKCRRYEAKGICTSPVALPEDRVRDALAFEIIGVDLAGPLTLRDGSKAWIVLFTCAVYRAVHLEIVSSLSTSCFLLSFRRFIARRGRPKIVYSDNGTNFTGAVNLFKTLEWNTIETDAAVLQIQWKFIPPTAAWWGGWWERLVRVVKRLLRRTLEKASLNYEEVLSLLCDCEATINSRPLTYLSDDPQDLQPLTPAMFIQYQQMVGVPDIDNLDKMNLSNRFQYLQRLRSDLRERFRAEYLGQLLQRPGKGGCIRGVKEGDVVLIGSDGKRRIDWPMAKVIKLFPGKDGEVRVVRLRTMNGEMMRPVQRLYPLEVSSPTDLVVEKGNSVTFPINKVKLTRSGRVVKLPSRFVKD